MGWGGQEPDLVRVLLVDRDDIISDSQVWGRGLGHTGGGGGG